MSSGSRPVLVIEDDPLLLELIRELLHLYGHKSVGAGTAEQARTIAAAAKPAVFLIDLVLPGLSGVDLAMRLRACGFPEEPMIAMSASAEMLRAARQSGVFQGTFRKPFEVMQLIQCVDESFARAGAGL